MKKKSPLIFVGALGAGALLAVAAPLAASAHVTVTPSNTAAGSYSLLTFSVPHGCDGSGTTSVRIQIPEDIIGVTPTVHPSWSVTKEMVDLPTPIKDSHGNSLAQRVGSVTYTTTTPLPDGYRDAFALQLKLPETVGETLVFPALQTCESGSTDWAEVAADGKDAHDLDAPAPTLKITAAATEHGEAPAAESRSAEQDVLARGLGIGGLALGAIGLIIGTLGLRSRSAARK